MVPRPGAGAAALEEAGAAVGEGDDAGESLVWGGGAGGDWNKYGGGASGAMTSSEPLAGAGAGEKDDEQSAAGRKRRSAINARGNMDDIDLKRRQTNGAEIKTQTNSFVKKIELECKVHEVINSKV